MAERSIGNGWSLFTHPCFAEHFTKLQDEVESLKARYPDTYLKKRATKLLYAVLKTIEDICRDPTLEKFRQVDTLGEENRHWFRAKFVQQYRLFFRYSAQRKTIILAWVNDEETKRAYGSKYDAYRVFSNRLSSGNPPDEWEQLLAESGENIPVRGMIGK